MCVCVRLLFFFFFGIRKTKQKKLTSKHNHDFNDSEGARDDGGGSGEKGLRASYEPFVNNSQRIEKEKTKRISEEK